MADVNDMEFSALLVSRVCHDLVGPLGAVINGLEILEDERNADMRTDALKLVAQSATQALARIQFMRIAFGAAGSAGAVLDLHAVGRLVADLLDGGRLRLEWHAPHVHWPKDWAKLLMNAALVGADCLPRGGVVRVEAQEAPTGFCVRATGPGARVPEPVEKFLCAQDAGTGVDARGVQSLLTRHLAQTVDAALAVVPGEGWVKLRAGPPAEDEVSDS